MNFNKMKKVVIFLIVFSYILPQLVFADSVSRPGANNKMKISKKTLDEKENSFFSRILRGDFDYGSSDKGNEDIIKQIRMLSDLNKDGILTQSEFEEKKKILLDKMK